MTLYDYRGQPVAKGVLKREVAEPTIVGVRPAIFASAAWGLDPERLGQIMADVDMNGSSIPYLTLAEEMEEREWHYHSVLDTRKGAVSGLNVMVESQTDSKRDNAIADDVRRVLTSEAATDLVSDLMDAVSKGYSVSELMWDTSASQWEPSQFIWRDPRWFVYDRFFQSELRMRDLADPSNGVPLPPYKFAVHTPNIKTGLKIRGGLARLAAVAFMIKSYTVKQWMSFSEVFGQPIRVGKHDPSATPEQRSTLLRAVSMIGSDASCIIPNTMEIEFQSANKAAGGDVLFKNFAEWIDEQVSKAVIGQTMTSDDGSSLAQAQVHELVRQDIKNNDSKQLSRTLRRDIVKPYVDLNYGPPKRGSDYPVVRLIYEKPEDLKLLSEALPPFINLGLRVEESVIRDKFGLSEPDPDALLLGVKPTPEQAPNPADKPDPTAPKNDDPKPIEDDAPSEADQALNAEIRATKVAILRRIREGVPVSAEDRALLTMRPALAAKRIDDEVDRLVNDALIDWQGMMSPVADPIIKLVQSAKTFKEVETGLQELMGSLGLKDFTQALATAAFKARGLGDSTDTP